jgi:hypothetical protein
MMNLAVPPKEISDSNAPVIDEDIVSGEAAAEHHPDQAAPKPPPPLHNGKEEKEGAGIKEEEKGVGHVMVEGGPERIQEVRAAEAAIIKSPETQVQASLQPAALDSEVAKVIAEEEMKDTIPPSPDVVRSVSPVSAPMHKPVSESRVATPDLQDDEDVLDLGEESGRKRGRADEGLENAPKRPKRQFRALPDPLSHFIHPPTTCLYISNLRRPLLLPTLHEYLFPSPTSESHSPLLPPTKGPFSSPDYPNIWLSGIKSHAYAVFDTTEEAIEVAKRIDGKQFPEETGAELKVDFVDEDEITRLVQREEQAWAGGRQKLDLRIIKVNEEGNEFKFELNGNGGHSNANSNGRGFGGRDGRPPPGPISRDGRRQAPVAVPLTGINAVPIGQRGGPGLGRDGFPGQGQGRNDRSQPPHLDRRAQGEDGYTRGGGDTYRPGPGGIPREGDRRTRVKPELSWREGPRAR